MITKQENTSPATSFVNVAHTPNDGPNLGREDTCSVKSEEDLPANKQGILIVPEESDKDDSVSEVSFNSFDIEAVFDIYDTNLRKNRIFKAVLFAFVLSASFLWRALLQSRGREQALQTQLDKLQTEMNQLKFDHMMRSSYCDDAFLEVDNCYFNFRASAALGSCAEDVTRNAYDWYEWGVDSVYSLFDDALYSDSDEGDQSENHHSETNALSNVYNEWVENVSAIFKQPSWDEKTDLEKVFEE